MSRIVLFSAGLGLSWVQSRKSACATSPASCCRWLGHAAKAPTGWPPYLKTRRPSSWLSQAARPSRIRLVIPGIKLRAIIALLFIGVFGTATAALVLFRIFAQLLCLFYLGICTVILLVLFGIFCKVTAFVLFRNFCTVISLVLIGIFLHSFLARAPYLFFSCYLINTHPDCWQRCCPCPRCRWRVQQQHTNPVSPFYNNKK